MSYRQQCMLPTKGNESAVARIQGYSADWDASGVYVTKDGSNRVSAWRDRSGKGNTVSQATGADQPLWVADSKYFNGKPSVQFAQSNTEFMSSSTAPILSLLSGSDVPMTIFCVVARAVSIGVSGANEVAFSLGNSASGSVNYTAVNWRITSNLQRFSVSNRGGTAGGVDAVDGGDLTENGPQILCASLSGTTASGYLGTIYQNFEYDIQRQVMGSNDYTTADSMTFNRLAIGAAVRNSTTLHMSGHIARIIVYNRELTTAERMSVFRYLRNTYMRKSISTPGDLTGLVHHWDASLVSDAVGQPCGTLTASTGGKNFTAADAARPTVRSGPNGNKVLEFNGTANVMTAGAAADWTFLHNATAKTVFVAFKPRATSDDGALHPVLDTGNNAPTTTDGLLIAYDNVGGNHDSLTYRVGNVGGTATLNSTSSVGVLIKGEWNVAHFAYEPTILSTDENFKLWVNGERYARTDQGATPSASAPAYSVAITSSASSGGGSPKIVLTVPAGHGVQVGDSITGSGHSEASVNATHTVTTVTATTITTDTAYVADGTGGALSNASRLTLGKLVGTGTYGSIQVAEIIIYNRQLGAFEQALIGEYLARKWNTNHTHVCAGNGLANILNEANTGYRAFPLQSVVTDSGRWMTCYRRSGIHGVPTTAACTIAYTNDRHNWTEQTVADEVDGFEEEEHQDVGVGPLCLIKTGPYAGRIVVAYPLRYGEDGTRIENGIVVRYSDNEGASWSDSIPVTNTSGVYEWRFGSGGMLQLEDGSIGLVYSGTPEGASRARILFTKSTDGGQTWSAEVTVADGATAPFTTDIQEPSLAIFSNGDILCLLKAVEDPPMCYSVLSTDSGATWGTPTDRFVSDSFNGCAVDEDDTLWIVYRGDDSGSYNDRTVYVKTDKTFSSITTELPMTPNTTTFEYAGLCSDDSGNVYCSWSTQGALGDADMFMRQLHSAT